MKKFLLWCLKAFLAILFIFFGLNALLIDGFGAKMIFLVLMFMVGFIASLIFAKKKKV